jgi:4-aminobutyrate aminotransferase-like enzyme
MEAIDAPQLAKNAGDELMGKLLTVPHVLDARGLGLLIAAEIDTAAIGKSAGEIALSCLEAGLVVNGVTASALRLAPPLNVSHEHIDEAIQILTNVLGGE